MGTDKERMEGEEHTQQTVGGVENKKRVKLRSSSFLSLLSLLSFPHLLLLLWCTHTKRKHTAPNPPTFDFYSETLGKFRHYNNRNNKRDYFVVF